MDADLCRRRSIFRNGILVLAFPAASYGQGNVISADSILCVTFNSEVEDIPAALCP